MKISGGIRQALVGLIASSSLASCSIPFGPQTTAQNKASFGLEATHPSRKVQFAVGDVDPALLAHLNSKWPEVGSNAGEVIAKAMFKRHAIATASLASSGVDATEGAVIALRGMAGWVFVTHPVSAAAVGMGLYGLSQHIATDMQSSWEGLNPPDRTFSYIPEGTYGKIKFPQHVLYDGQTQLYPALICLNWQPGPALAADNVSYFFWRMTRGGGTPGSANGCAGTFSPGTMGNVGSSADATENVVAITVLQTHEIWRMIRYSGSTTGYRAVRLGRFTPLPNTAAGKLQGLGELTATRIANAGNKAGAAGTTPAWGIPGGMVPMAGPPSEGTPVLYENPEGEFEQATWPNVQGDGFREPFKVLADPEFTPEWNGLTDWLNIEVIASRPWRLNVIRKEDNEDLGIIAEKSASEGEQMIWYGTRWGELQPSGDYELKLVSVDGSRQNSRVVHMDHEDTETGPITYQEQGATVTVNLVDPERNTPPVQSNGKGYSWPFRSLVSHSHKHVLEFDNTKDRNTFKAARYYFDEAGNFFDSAKWNPPGWYTGERNFGNSLDYAKQTLNTANRHFGVLKPVNVLTTYYKLPFPAEPEFFKYSGVSVDGFTPDSSDQSAFFLQNGVLWDPNHEYEYIWP